MSSNKRKRGNASLAPTTPVKIEYEGHEETVPLKLEPLSSPQIKPEIASSRTTTPKKIKIKEPLAKREPPANFQAAWDIIRDFRSVNLAAVDTMGCERLADAEADPKAFRFQTLVALMLSSQTKDPVTAQAMKNIQAWCDSNSRAFDVDTILGMTDTQLDSLIGKVGFHTRKTSYIKETAQLLKDTYDSDIPNDLHAVLGFRGVGPKMAHLFMQVAFNASHGIGVDTHVHRISRRLGWTKTKEGDPPEQTRLELESWLPKDKWAAINPLLVGFGQTLCAPIGPGCERCPVNAAGLCPTGKKVKVKVKETKE